MIEDINDQIIKTDEVAQMMSVSIPHFYHLRKKGKTPPALPNFNRPRFSKRVVEIWLDVQKELSKLEVLQQIEKQKKELENVIK